MAIFAAGEDKERAARIMVFMGEEEKLTNHAVLGGRCKISAIACTSRFSNKPSLLIRRPPVAENETATH